MQEHTLKIGESFYLKKGIFVSHGIGYAGMPTDSTYSLLITYHRGHNSMAYNLFFRLSQREIALPKGHLTILRVTPQEILLRTVR
ncbi:MAG: hypothetical protein JSV44_07400 [Candidatus Zixiibacteriota bacterium]|nr:MAG: hypothetical protein JSV44_07400 [candidate division Zixibacteria bacterium]